ncbi:hypothetical protein HZC35_01660 [Candidatus Saganbacteria bacterium]|nr:hypothetical protein [Candidatus Saganbacteria bacterium]
MESGRVITSKIYGELGRFAATRRPNLYRSPSGRVLVLGEGALGGKGEGTAYLDRNAGKGKYKVPRQSLVICDDYFGIPAGNARIKRLDPQKVADLSEILQEAGFPARLAIRSSSVLEDQPGHSAAGRFLTKYRDSEARYTDLVSDLLEVLNSNYDHPALIFQRSLGVTEAPPLPVIIQELVASEFTYAPRHFFPLLSGIINTASPGMIKIATVPGLGSAAVGGKGLLHIFDPSLLLLKERGVIPNFIDVLHNGLDFKYNSEGRAHEIITKSSPHLQRRLARIALRLQKRIGSPLDIEWALNQEGDKPYLLQVRPLTPKGNLPRPNISAERTLLSTREVVGQAAHTFTHICIIDFPGLLGYPSEQLLKKMVSYPDSILICRIWVTQTAPQVLSRLLPYAASLIVLDSAQYDHAGGVSTGIDHVALFAADEKKVILYSGVEAGFLEQIQRGARLIDKAGQVHRGKLTDVLKIYKLSEPLTIAGSDEDGWGMIYRGGTPPRRPRE